LFQAKKEYKEIVEILKAQGIKISFGSCWNIVSKWKTDSNSDSNSQSIEIKNHFPREPESENRIERESTQTPISAPTKKLEEKGHNQNHLGLGHSGYFKVGNVYRLPAEDSSEPMLVLVSGAELPVSYNSITTDQSSKPTLGQDDQPQPFQAYTLMMIKILPRNLYRWRP
jgi:hypothetical protein